MMKMILSLKFLVLALSGFVLMGCQAGENQTNIELAQQMFDQKSVKAQDWDPNKKDNLAMRVPPEGTVPRGFKPYPYNAAEILKAAKELRNPLNGNFGTEVLMTGKKHYDIYCGICHGDAGAGDGTVAAKMTVKPPSLISGKVLGYSDGRMFHAVTMGYGVMGSYSRQIRSENDRWAVINYIRNLQKKAN